MSLPGMTAPARSEWLCVGKVTGAYGIKGWVRVHAYTDSLEDFLRLSGWHIAAAQDADRRRPVEIAEGRRQGKGLIVRLVGVDDRTAAERLRGQQFWVPATQLPELEEGEYYWRDLIGLRVFTRSDQGEALLLGEVDHLLETGANDVMVLRACEGSVDSRERLIPWLPGDVVLDVATTSGRIDVRWHPDD